MKKCRLHFEADCRCVMRSQRLPTQCWGVVSSCCYLALSACVCFSQYLLYLRACISLSLSSTFNLRAVRLAFGFLIHWYISSTFPILFFSASFLIADCVLSLLLFLLYCTVSYRLLPPSFYHPFIVSPKLFAHFFTTTHSCGDIIFLYLFHIYSFPSSSTMTCPTRQLSSTSKETPQ